MPRSTDFVITVHTAERVIEVVYPSHPTMEACAGYEADLTAAVKKLGGKWQCLVDQRAITVAPQEVSEKIAALNAWAKKAGMTWSARVVKQSAIAELQARRIIRESGMEDHSGLFHTREEAWEALTRRSPSSTRAPKSMTGR